MPLYGGTLVKIGVDVLKLDRMRLYTAVSKGHRGRFERFLVKFFSPREAKLIEAHIDDMKQTHEFMGGRWAAKEAIIKCLTPHAPRPSRIEVFQRPSGPLFALANHRRVDDDAPDSSQSTNARNRQVAPVANKRALIAEPEDFAHTDALYVDLSLSHDAGIAIAIATVETGALAAWVKTANRPGNRDGQQGGDAATD